jgi:flagellar motor switch protein FliM
MAKEFRSQDEVDALLKGVSGDGEEEAAAEETAGPRPYNLAKQERIVRGRMPTLEIVNERFARLLRVGLFNFMRRTAEISVSQVKTQKYSEFIRNLAVPTNLNVIHVKPLRGSALVIFEPTLVFLVIDSLFGSDGRFHTRIEGREFTPTEQRIIQRLIEAVFENLEKAWQPVHPLGAEATGAIHICAPDAMLEPIRDLLFSTPQGERMEPDKRWLRMLSRQVQAAEVQLSATLCRTTLSLGQVRKLKPGDVIRIDVDDTVNAEVDGVPVMDCRYGVCNGQYALQVVRMMHHGVADEATAGTAPGAKGG